MGEAPGQNHTASAQQIGMKRVSTSLLGSQLWATHSRLGPKNSIESHLYRGDGGFDSFKWAFRSGPRLNHCFQASARHSRGFVF